jgi:hypothetical protein
LFLVGRWSIFVHVFVFVFFVVHWWGCLASRNCCPRAVICSIWASRLGKCYNRLKSDRFSQKRNNNFQIMIWW